MQSNSWPVEAHKHARGNDLKKNPITRNEVEPLLAILLTMGVLGYPSVRYYK